MKRLKRIAVVVFCLLLAMGAMFGCGNLADELEYLRNRVDQLEQQNTERRQEIYDLNNQLALERNRIAQLEAQLATEHAALVELQSRIATQNSRVAELEQARTLIEAELDEMMSNLSELADYKIPELLATLSDIDEELIEVRQSISDLETAKQNQFNRITDLERQIQLLEQRVYELEHPPHFAVIMDEAGLAAMADHPRGTFRLGTDLVLSDWEPIFSAENPFVGELYSPLDEYGQPLYGITTLTISDTVYGLGAYYAALIGHNQGTIRNIVINNLVMDIEVDDPSVAAALLYVGGIAGDSTGRIINSHILNANISVTVPGGMQIRAGGLAGKVRGASAIISDSSASGVITTYGVAGITRAGGLVGNLEDGASALRTSANVDVTVNTVGGNASGAGLVGHTERGATIRQSYARGNVTTTSSAAATVYAGGLSGNTAAENPRPSGASEDFRWNFEFREVFATGNALGISNGNAYVASLIARIAESGGAPSDITVRDAYATGSATIERTIAAGSINLFAGGITGRIQSTAGSIIIIDSSFVTGDITGIDAGSSSFAAAIAGRSQNNGTRLPTNLWVYDGMAVVGIQHSDSIHTNHADVSVAPMSELLSAGWQQQNLGWSDSVWIFEDGELPVLDMELLRSAAAGYSTGGLWLSHAPGVFEEEFDLTVRHQNPNAVIYWTIDGAEPTPGTPRFVTRRGNNIQVSGRVGVDGIIPVRDRTSHWRDSILTSHSQGFGGPIGDAIIRQGIGYRFRAFVGVTPVSSAITTTYLVWQDFAENFADIPIIAVTAAYQDFLDVYADTAITQTAVRRNFYYEFFETVQNSTRYQRKFHLPGSTQLGGMSSRGNPQRTFNVHVARGDLDGHITYPVFEGLYDLTRFRLWNGGNGFWRCLMRDPFVQKAAYLANMNVIHADYRLAIKFINGEFWGFTTIREHTSNNHFTYSRLDITPRNNASILNATWYPDLHSEVEESAGGRTEIAYAKLYDFVRNNDLSLDLNRQKLFEDFFCEENFIDYLIANTFFSNKDWPFVNVRLVRAAEPDSSSDSRYMDGLWRFILHDMDSAMQSTGFFGRPVDYNPFIRLLDPSLLLYRHQGTTYSYLFTVLRNLTFAQRVRDRGIELLEIGLMEERLVALLDYFVAERISLLEEHYNRFSTMGGVDVSMQNWYSYVEESYQFITSRHTYYRSHLEQLVIMAG